MGSQVWLDYQERAPFAFDGTIEEIHILYLGREEPATLEVIED